MQRRGGGAGDNKIALAAGMRAAASSGISVMAQAGETSKGGKLSISAAKAYGASACNGGVAAAALEISEMKSALGSPGAR